MPSDYLFHDSTFAVARTADTAAAAFLGPIKLLSAAGFLGTSRADVAKLIYESPSQRLKRMIVLIARLRPLMLAQVVGIPTVRLVLMRERVGTTTEFGQYARTLRGNKYFWLTALSNRP